MARKTKAAKPRTLENIELTNGEFAQAISARHFMQFLSERGIISDDKGPPYNVDDKAWLSSLLAAYILRGRREDMQRLVDQGKLTKKAFERVAKSNYF